MKSFNVLSIVLAVSMALSACDQNQKQSQSTEHPTNTTSATASSTIPAQTQAMHHDHASIASATTSTASQPSHIDAYMASMSAMHTDMTAGLQANNADEMFAKGMIPHHEGAVAMAKVQLQYGKDTEMKALAQKIIDAQQGEIQFMQDWLKQDSHLANHTEDLQAVVKAYQAGNGKSHNAMMQGMMDKDADVAFVKGMIPHHQGAVDMADVQLKYGKDKAMRELAEQIKNAQNPEIQQMQNWLTKKGLK
ncbi:MULTISPECIES: DUF305 domain-containing protein [unclassified Moraxella]|uniref:CopM family metallochaperone n=1 Tax=unclassified Moraxella TaxID=2685852 RepID=UPI003AF5FA21